LGKQRNCKSHLQKASGNASVSELLLLDLPGARPPAASPVGEQEQRLLRCADGPVRHDAVDLGQVLGRPAGGSTQHQVEEGTSWGGAVPLAPQEGALVLRQAERGNARSCGGGVTVSKIEGMFGVQCYVKPAFGF